MFSGRCFLVFIGITFFQTALIGQSHCELLYDNQWVLGDPDDTIQDRYGGSIIRFFPDFLIDRKHKTFGQIFTYALISDRNGEFLSASNGCFVFNSTGENISGDDGINPGEIHDIDCPDDWGYGGIHNMFFLPDSYDTSVYYLIHINEVYNRAPNAPFIVQHENFYITSMRQSPADGEVEIIEKNKIVFTDTGMIGQPVTAVKHANGLDWWMITPDRWSNGFHTVLLDQTGVVYLGKQYIGTPTIPRADGGQGKFSPDGSHFAWYQPHNGLFFYDFDRSSGMLSNFRHVDVPVGADLVTGGLEFSPQGRFLYVNHYFSLYQLDLLEEDLQASLTHIADYDGFADPPSLFTIFLYMERTPDKRIFLNPRSSSQYLHVIQEPDKKGPECRFEQHTLKLPTINTWSIPHFPNYRLGAVGEPLCDSLIVSSEKAPEVIHDSLYTLYPNPTSTTLNVSPDSGDSAGSVKVILTNALGQIALPSSPFPLNVSGIAPGIYTATLSVMGYTVQSSKVIILPRY